MTDFGQRLREARERRGISIREMSATTKISAAAFEALERNDVTRLPEGIFRRAIVRAYAAEVGLPPEEAVREFQAAFQPLPIDPPEDPSRSPEFDARQRMALVVIGAVVASVVLAGALILLALRQPRGDVAGTLAPPSRDEFNIPAAHESDLDDGSPTRTGATDPLAVSIVPASTNPPARADGLALEVHPTGSCWVDLTVDGLRVLARVVQPGERLAFTVRTLAVLKVGDAGAFEYSLNGEAGRPLGRSGQVRTVRISPETLADYAPPDAAVDGSRLPFPPG